MPRTLTTHTEIEISKTITRPIYLVSFSYDPYVRFSSGPTLTWKGAEWQSNDLVIQLNAQGKGGMLQIGNTNLAFGQKVLADGLSDIEIRIYKLYGDAPYADDDGVQLYHGAGGKASIDERWVSIPLIGPSNTMLYFPFYRACEENGFKWLPPDGTKISWGGEIFVFEQKDE